MATNYFPGVPDRIPFDPKAKKGALAFKQYNADEMVEGRSMREWLRFSVCYWHTFRGTGSDPFGPGTMDRPWDDGSDSVENALKRVDVAFDFIDRLGAPFYCFHDRDVAPEGATLAESNKYAASEWKKAHAPAKLLEWVRRFHAWELGS